MKKVLGIIPARLNSTRLPGKMLADICGKPLIFYTIQQAKKSKLLDDLVLATDSEEIKRAVKDTGIQVIMTSAKHKCGSDRVAEAAKKFKKFKPEIIAILLVIVALFLQYKIHFALNKLSKSIYWQSEKWMEDNRRLISKIPKDMSLASTQNIVPHLSHRSQIYLI